MVKDCMAAMAAEVSVKMTATVKMKQIKACRSSPQKSGVKCSPNVMNPACRRLQCIERHCEDQGEGDLAEGAMQAERDATVRGACLRACGRARQAGRHLWRHLPRL